MSFLTLLPELVAVVGGTVHTQVPGEEPRPATLIVEGDSIRAVLAADAPLPDDIDRIVDVAGQHVVPGLIDGLVYFDPEHDALYVASGVTLVRDVGSTPERVLHEREPQARDRNPGPTLLTAGVLLDGSPPGTAEALVLADPSQVPDALAPLFEVGVDFLSVQPQLSEACWRAVLAEALKHDLSVWGHVPKGVALSDALAAGHRGLFYLDALLPPETDWAFVLPVAFRASAKIVAEGGGAVVPLLGGVHTRLQRLTEDAEQDAADELFLEHVSPFYDAWWRADLARRRGADPELVRVGRRVRGKQLDVLQMLHENKVRLLPGSSAPHPWMHPGAGLHAELALWEEAGVEPADVLHAATRGAAEILGVEDRHGALGPGLSADFLVVEDDPREGLATLRDPAWVAVRGRLLDEADLMDLLATLRVEQRRAREEAAAPLAIPEPPLPDGEVLISGQIETGAGGVRVGGERYAIVREADGTLAYCGRMVSPGSSSIPPSELVVVQRLRDDRLQSFEFVAQQGEHELRVEGLRVAGRLNVRRFADGKPANAMTTLERIEVVSIGSITSLLALAQRGPLEEGESPYAVLHFHDRSEPEVVPWYFGLDERGVFFVLSQQANHGFVLRADGTPELWEQQHGSGSLVSVAVLSDTPGGAGHPLPASVAEAVAARRAAAARAASAPLEAAQESSTPEESAAEEGRETDAEGAGPERPADDGA